jgi:hypothetical protein
LDVILIDDQNYTVQITGEDGFSKNLGIFSGEKGTRHDLGYSRISSEFNLGLISPSVFLNILKNTTDLLPSIDFLIVRDEHSEFDDLSWFKTLKSDRWVFGSRTESRLLFDSSLDCKSHGIDALCDQVTEICKTYDAPKEFCLNAIESCLLGEGQRMDDLCIKEAVVDRIKFKEDYRTPTSFVSVDSRDPFVLSGVVTRYLAKNAKYFNADFPNMELSLGHWLAPVGDVEFISYS